MYEVSKCAPQEALRNLDRAFDNFFKKRNKFPRFKNKKNNKTSFKLNGTIKVTNNIIQLPRIGIIRLKEKGYLPKDKKILSATISEHAGKWFVSILIEEQQEFVGTKDLHDIV